MRVVQIDNIALGLPGSGAFGRPFWAYDYLPGGRDLLRRLVFSDTSPLLDDIESYGDCHLSYEDVLKMAQKHCVFDDVAFVLASVAHKKTARALARWYRGWEQRAFEAYCSLE
jgi:hypothetical protein